VIVRTDVDGVAGHGFAFTIGRGNEIQRTAIAAGAGIITGARS
jgi:L-fuconate dehydratase